MNSSTQNFKKEKINRFDVLYKDASQRRIRHMKLLQQKLHEENEKRLPKRLQNSSKKQMNWNDKWALMVKRHEGKIKQRETLKNQLERQRDEELSKECTFKPANYTTRFSHKTPEEQNYLLQKLKKLADKQNEFLQDLNKIEETEHAVDMQMQHELEMDLVWICDKDEENSVIDYYKDKFIDEFNKNQLQKLDLLNDLIRLENIFKKIMANANLQYSDISQETNFDTELVNRLKQESWYESPSSNSLRQSGRTRQILSAVASKVLTRKYFAKSKSFNRNSSYNLEEENDENNYGGYYSDNNNDFYFNRNNKNREMMNEISDRSAETSKRRNEIFSVGKELITTNNNKSKRNLSLVHSNAITTLRNNNNMEPNPSAIIPRNINQHNFNVSNQFNNASNNNATYNLFHNQNAIINKSNNIAKNNLYNINNNSNVGINTATTVNYNYNNMQLPYTQLNMHHAENGEARGRGGGIEHRQRNLCYNYPEYVNNNNFSNNIQIYGNNGKNNFDRNMSNNKFNNNGKMNLNTNSLNEENLKNNNTYNFTYRNNNMFNEYNNYTNNNLNNNKDNLVLDSPANLHIHSSKMPNCRQSSFSAISTSPTRTPGAFGSRGTMPGGGGGGRVLTNVVNAAAINNSFVEDEMTRSFQFERNNVKNRRSSTPSKISNHQERMISTDVNNVQNNLAINMMNNAKYCQKYQSLGTMNTATNMNHDKRVINSRIGNNNFTMIGKDLYSAKNFTTCQTNMVEHEEGGTPIGRFTKEQNWQNRSALREGTVLLPANRNSNTSIVGNFNNVPAVKNTCNMNSINSNTKIGTNLSRLELDISERKNNEPVVAFNRNVNDNIRKKEVINNMYNNNNHSSSVMPTSLNNFSSSAAFDPITSYSSFSVKNNLHTVSKPISTLNLSNFSTQFPVGKLSPNAAANNFGSIGSIKEGKGCVGAPNYPQNTNSPSLPIPHLPLPPLPMGWQWSKDPVTNVYKAMPLNNLANSMQSNNLRTLVSA